jgi:hypothetical protein
MQPLEYFGWSYAKKKVARAYMQKEIKDRKKEYREWGR